MKIGSLFSGYEGLGMAVQSVLGGDIAWVSDIDPGACKILAHRYPDVPNIGDITTVDWSAVEPVDVLTGGFPCQDVSCAGLRKGLRPDTRSGLWTQMAYAIDQLRPSLVVIENVRGLLSAEAHSDLEPCPWCVGDGGGVPLRALGAVLGDLADIGYDASWQGLRAADVGAPHGRFRVFVTAYPNGSPGSVPWCVTPGPAQGVAAEAGGRAGRGSRTPAQDPDLAARGERRLAAPGQAEGGRSRADARGRGGAPTTDTHRHALREQPVTLAGSGGPAVTGHAGADATADSDSDGLEGVGRLHTLRRDVDGRGSAHVAWGQYEPAVRRWEALTRPAPAPTEPGKTGQPRLSPAFVEWMQGLPADWVTDVPGLTRNEQLKALGNGVVPQQAAQALRMLLPDVQAVAA